MSTPDGTSDRRRARAIRRAAIAVAAAVVVAGGVVLLRDGEVSPGDSPTDDAPSTYYIDRSELLMSPPEPLRQALHATILSWEEPTSSSDDPTISFTVTLANRSDRAIAVADVVVVPAEGTAPGVTLEREGFVRLTLEAGAERAVDVRAVPVASGAEPSPSADARFGLHLYVVAAFAADVPPPETLPTPSDPDAFRRVWGSFSSIGSFTEVSPEILVIVPAG